MHETRNTSKIVDPKRWLVDVVIFNESESYLIPDHVSVYRSIGDMCAGMETWMADEGLGFALNGLGQRVELVTDGEQVVGSLHQALDPDPATLLIWLKHSAAELRDARLFKSKKKGWMFWSPPILGEEEVAGTLPETVEGLIAYLSI